MFTSQQGIIYKNPKMNKSRWSVASDFLFGDEGFCVVNWSGSNEVNRFDVTYDAELLHNDIFFR